MLHSWLNRFLNWLVDGRLFWFSCTIIIGAISLSLLPAVSEQQIRLVGLLLQLLGISTVVVGISNTRKLFSLPSFTTDVIRWLKSFPRIRLPKISGAGALAAGQATVEGHGTVTDKPLSIEDRVTRLEAELPKRIYELKQEFRSHLSIESSVRITEIDSLRTKLTTAETSGHHLSLTGLLWLSIGLIMSTASNEITNGL